MIPKSLEKTCNYFGEHMHTVNTHALLRSTMNFLPCLACTVLWTSMSVNVSTMEYVNVKHNITLTCEDHK